MLRARLHGLLALLGEAGFVAIASIVAAAAVLLRDMSISTSLGRTHQTDALLAGLAVATTVAQLVPGTFQTTVFAVAVRTRVAHGPRAVGELLGHVSARFAALGVMLAAPLVILAQPIAKAIAPADGVAALASVLPVLAVFAAALSINELGKAIYALERRYVAFAVVGGAGNLALGGLLLWRSPSTAEGAARLAGAVFGIAVMLTWGSLLVKRLVRFRAPPIDSTVLRGIYAQALPSMAAGVLTIGMSVVDQVFTMSLGEGKYATLSFASRWPMFTTQLPALALGTVLLRTLAEDAVSLDPRALRARVRQTFAVGFAVGAVATIGGLLVGPLIVRATLQRGAFTAADASAVISVQSLLFVQAPFYVGGIVYLRVLNALRLNHVAFVIGAAVLALNAALDWAFTRYWHLGVHGIALSTVGVYAFSSACLVATGEYVLRKRDPRPPT